MPPRGRGHVPGSRHMSETLSRLIDGNPTILVVGDLILDRYVWGVVERISPEAPVQVLRWASGKRCTGGSRERRTQPRRPGLQCPPPRLHRRRRRGVALRAPRRRRRHRRQPYPAPAGQAHHLQDPLHRAQPARPPRRQRGKFLSPPLKRKSSFSTPSPRPSKG